MNPVNRGIRNAFRNGIRTGGIVIIVGISIGLSLIMLIAHKAVDDKIGSVKASIDNTVTVSPAGFRGFDGNGNPLTQSSIEDLKSLAHVSSIVETVSDRLRNGTNTNLQSAVDAGSLGRRFGGFGGGIGAPDTQGGASDGTSGTVPQTFTPPVNAVGSTDPLVASGTSLKITSGSTIDGTADNDIALVGRSLATKNNLKVGSTFTAYNDTITVAGIFDSGTTFGNNEIIFPLPTLQRLSSQSGDLTAATINVDSISNIDSVTTAVKGKLGSSADVTSSKDQAQSAIQPLDSVKTISTVSLIGALVAGAIIILLTMVMIVRERKREIGITKAIGGSNLRIMGEFVIESLTLTVLGAVIGLLIGVAGAQPVTKMLVTNSVSSATSAEAPGGFGGGGRAGGQRGFGGGFRRNGAVRSISTIKTEVGAATILEGFGAAILIAITGSGLASGLIAKVRPSEVLRSI